MLVSPPQLWDTRGGALGATLAWPQGVPFHLRGDGEAVDAERYVLAHHLAGEVGRRQAVDEDAAEGIRLLRYRQVPAQVLEKLMHHDNNTTTMGYYPNIDEIEEDAVLGNDIVKRDSLRTRLRVSCGKYAESFDAKPLSG